MANPPFNLKHWFTKDVTQQGVNWADYGTPPESNANYAWILHILSKLKANKGIAGFLLANGALGDDDTVAIRQKLIENDNVEAIIVLPRELFYTTDISVTLWILNLNKRGGMHHGRQQRDRRGEILYGFALLDGKSSQRRAEKEGGTKSRPSEASHRHILPLASGRY